VEVGVRLLVDGYNIEGVCDARPDGTCEEARHDVERGLLLLVLLFLPDVARLEVRHHVLVNSELRRHKHAIGREERYGTPVEGGDTAFPDLLLEGMRQILIFEYVVLRL
jgi:hypothetical protein